MNKRFYIISFLAILIIIAGFLSLKPEAQAVTSGGVTSPVSGTAIITNMNYPIRFLGYDGGTSGNIPYSVQYNSVTGFSGYGWSPQYGWINFSGSKATALSLQNPNDTENAEWADGAIKLSGSTGGTSGNISYSVSFDQDGTANSVNRWAWGGNVIGWVDFSGVKITLVTNPNDGFCSWTHWICIQGTSVKNVEGTDAWTWDCNGINGGTDAIDCFENKTPPTCTDDDIAGLTDPINPPCYCSVAKHKTEYACKKKPGYKEN